MFTDPILLKLVEKYPAPSWNDRSDVLFQEIVESIVSQQLSINAADTILNRFVNLFGEDFPTPKQITQIETEKVREAGLSYAKIKYVKAVAEAFESGQLDGVRLRSLTDEEVKTELTKIKGVGPWTAEMILIFTLNRPDVFSIGDAGLRRAVANLYGISEVNEILKLAEGWRPNRSTAAWYLWRSLENS